MINHQAVARNNKIQKERPRKGGGRKPRIIPRSATGRTPNFYPQSGRFVNNPSRRPRSVQKPQSNRAVLARLEHLQGPDKRPGKKRKVVPRSASSSFIARRSPNTWAHFPRPKRKGERAYTKDISGRPLRTKNYETPRREVILPTFKPYYGRKRVGDRPYKGPTGGYVTSRKREQRAWKGDVTGRKIRGRNYSSKTVEGTPVFPPKKKRLRSGDRAQHTKLPGTGYQSISQPGEKRTGKFPLPVRTPGIGAVGIGKYKGNLRLYQARPGLGTQGADYSGNIKAKRPAKGGGSVSGKRWNNQGNPVQVRTPGIGADGIGKYKGKQRLFEARPGMGKQGTDYSGNIRTGRPPKGGGSISGRRWNNEGNPIQVRTPGIGADRIGKYQGNIKARRPDKGGGSRSGKLWNNYQTPIEVRTPSKAHLKLAGFPGKIKRYQMSPGYNNQGEEFTGYTKAKKPKKGGDSVSGKLWNNKETPIPVRTPPASAQEQSGYPGNIKRYALTPGYNNQGEEFTGYIKLPKFKKSYVKNPNSAEESLKKKRPDKTTYEVGDLQVKVKRRDYVRNDNTADESLKKLKPTKTTEAVAGLQVKVKRRDYVTNDNTAEGALKKLKPTKTTQAVAGLQVKVKQYHYIRNSSSSDDALKVREPGKAFVKATDYQGNIKMKKFDLFGRRDLHPDAKFVKTNKNNVAEERDMLTNFKLWWARLFKKSDNQPDHLKEKVRKPRYDKGEQGMWND